MPETSTAPSDIVVAKETIVVVVGARPVEYARVVVKDKRTTLDVEIDDTDNPPIDEGDIGVSYAFREGQKVRRSHPAVEACPGGFRDLEPADAFLYPDEITQQVR